VYVSAAGMVRVGRHYSKGVRDLAAEAVEAALAESNVDSVDYLIVASSASYLQAPQLDLASYVAAEAGVQAEKALAVEAGESSGLAAAEVAVSLIRSGAARRVLVVGVDKLTEYNSGLTYKGLQAIYDTEADAFYNIGHAAEAALAARLYMDRYGVSREDLAYWPAMMHAHAKENPYAMLRFAVDPARVPSAMPVAEPLTLLDSYPLGDGAAAVLFTAEDEAGDHLARVGAVTSARGLPSPALRDDPLRLEALEQVARAIAADPESFDVVELHDSFSIMGVLSLEALGLAPRGQAAKLVAEGAFTVGGRGPVVNPSGGLKARGHPIGATDVYKIAEAALQLAGEFPGVKVEGARRALVASLNGLGSSARALVLEAL